MLKSLKIKNFAILLDNEILFSEGLNIISGETASGKSLILKAIKFVTGEKVEKDIIGNLADVQALFDISKNELLSEYLKDQELYTNEDLIIRRVTNEKGNKIFINGILSSNNVLAYIASEIVNLCGQNDNIKIINPKNQLKILDTYCNIPESLSNMKQIVDEYNQVNKILKEKELIEKEKDSKIEILKYQLRDLESLKISPNDEQEIELKIQEAKTYKAKNEISDSFAILMDESDLSSRLGVIYNKLSKIENPDVIEFTEKLNKTIDEIDGLLVVYNRFKKTLKYSNDLDALASKIEIINKIKKKYGSVKELFIKRDSLKKEMKSLEENEEEVRQLKMKKNKVLANYNNLAQEISKKRKEKASIFSKMISEELQELNMMGALFDIRFELNSEPSYNGMDKIEFLVTTNKGFDLKPMGKIASGGELSRIMLSINKISNLNEELTLIFDEIDSGIGGNTGNVIGQKINEISKINQVICISHLPQVSVYSDNHIIVHKEIVKQKTISITESMIDQQSKINEIARMLSGDTTAEATTMVLAKEMVIKAKKTGG